MKVGENFTLLYWTSLLFGLVMRPNWTPVIGDFYTKADGEYLFLGKKKKKCYPCQVEKKLYDWYVSEILVAMENLQLHC